MEKNSKKFGGDRNQCPGCSQYFNSTRAFEKHRTGEFGVDRRCMTTAEMLARGMAISSSGFWVTALMPDAAHANGNDSEAA